MLLQPATETTAERVIPLPTMHQTATRGTDALTQAYTSKELQGIKDGVPTINPSSIINHLHDLNDS